ncbi:MAG: thioredoxin-disulfide reductase [Conexivisphaerales archaeon]
MSFKEHSPVLILGSGPAGLTAAIYAARAGYAPLVIGGFEFGGQLMLTTYVENFPGFPKGILGPELMEAMKKQAEEVGARIINDNATSVDFSSRPFKVYINDDLYTADAVIVATGASAKWLGLESEQRLRGRGVSSCAVCDGSFFKGKDVALVGGGDSAMEDAIYLSKICRKVTVIHRRDKLRASAIMQARAKSRPNIEFVWDSVVEEVVGKERVEAVKVRNLKTNKIEFLPVSALFVAIGHQPNTEIFKGQLEIDEKGYLKVKDETRTNIEGVFAAGDVADPIYRQAVTAAGLGARAAIDAVRYLESLNIEQKLPEAVVTASAHQTTNAS